MGLDNGDKYESVIPLRFDLNADVTSKENYDKSEGIFIATPPEKKKRRSWWILFSIFLVVSNICLIFLSIYLATRNGSIKYIYIGNDTKSILKIIPEAVVIINETDMDACSYYGLYGIQNSDHPDCIPEPPPTSKPFLWLGDAPDSCHANSSDCSHYGLVFDVSHARGPKNALWCKTGNKYRCVAPDLNEKPINTPNNILKVMSYNIFERPYTVTSDGQRERTCRIPKWLIENTPDVDVMTFQELFVGGCIPEAISFKDLLSYYGFKYTTDVIRSGNKIVNGGSLIASKWPITLTDSHEYANSQQFTADALSAKGVTYAKINKSGVIYHIMNTHLQSGGDKYGDNWESVIKSQAVEWASFIERLNISHNETLLFTGDFNVDYHFHKEVFASIIENINAAIPQIDTNILPATMDGRINDIVNITFPESKPLWLDYILHSRLHKQPKTYKYSVLNPKIQPPFEVCWCEICLLKSNYLFDKSDCAKVVKISSLSDHLPVLAEYTFDSPSSDAS